MGPTRRLFLLGSSALAGLAAFGCRTVANAMGGHTGPEPTPAVPGLEADPQRVVTITRRDAEWKTALDDEAYTVLRHQGTERAFSGRYWDNHAEGTYLCRGCGLRLFSSAAKFESGTGWPSFFEPIAEGRVEVNTDSTLGMVRDEVHCARCAGHMGHVFNDGPKPTGLRYCMDSASLIFVPKPA